jgi:hypothetical protein
MKALFVILGVVFVLSCVPALVVFFRARWRYSGLRIVRCPETKRKAKIRLDATHAAVTELGGAADLRVEECSLWDGSVGQCCEDCLETDRPKSEFARAQ